MAIGPQTTNMDTEDGIPPFPVRLFSVEEYHRLGELGVLTEDDKVELLEGWIVPKAIRKRGDCKERPVTAGLNVAASNAETPPYPVHTFSVDDYERLIEAGVLTEDDKVELLEGWIVPMMVHGDAHDGVVGLIDHRLRPHIPDGWTTRIQSAITVRQSVPEPDIAVARGTLDEFCLRRPDASRVSLVIEVADSSLSLDRQKARIYAEAGIPLYWIVSIPEGLIEVYSNPDSKQAKYGNIAQLERSDKVTLILDGERVAELQVAQLLPPQ